MSTKTKKSSTNLERFERLVDGRYLVRKTSQVLDPYTFDPKVYRRPMEAISLRKIAREQGMPLLHVAIDWCLEYHYERRLIEAMVDGTAPQVLRKDGKTLEVKHPLRILLELITRTWALELEEFTSDEIEILCVVILLHDILEDSHVTKKMLRETFGRRVAKYVAVLSRKGRKSKENSREYIEGVMKYFISLIGKIADRRDTIYDAWIFTPEKLEFAIWESKYFLGRAIKELRKSDHPAAQKVLELLQSYIRDIKDRVVVAENILLLMHQNEKKDGTIKEMQEIILDQQEENTKLIEIFTEKKN